MTTDAEIAAPSPPPDTTKKGPGRPRLPILETPQQRIERLQAELRHAHEALKRAEEQRATIVGTAVVNHARTNEDFRRQLAAILRAGIKSKADLTTIADLLVGPPPASSSAAPP